MTLVADSLSQDSSWAESDFPPAQPEGVLPPDDATHFVNPPDNVCPVCGEEVVRIPGSRGRVPKYHPECKPQRGGNRSTSSRSVRVSKAEQIAAEEVEAALENARRGLMKAVAMLSLADPYDALVLHVNSKDLLDNLRPVLMRFPSLRKGASDATTIGSVFGLAVTVLTTLLPIATHHNLIPKGKVSQIFLNMPFFMMRLQERMANAESAEAMGDELLLRVTQEAKKQQEAEMKRRTAAESVNATNAR